MIISVIPHVNHRKGRSFVRQAYLLDELPAVLTHHDFTQLNILADDDGSVTGAIDFDEAKFEALEMCIFGLYECFFGEMDQGVFSFYNQAADDGSGRSVRWVLEDAFWSLFWANSPSGLTREKLQEPLRVAVDVCIVHRYFDLFRLDNIDSRSLTYAHAILLRD